MKISIEQTSKGWGVVLDKKYIYIKDVVLSVASAIAATTQKDLKNGMPPELLIGKSEKWIPTKRQAARMKKNPISKADYCKKVAALTKKRNPIKPAGAARKAAVKRKAIMKKNPIPGLYRHAVEVSKDAKTWTKVALCKTKAEAHAIGRAIFAQNQKKLSVRVK